MATRARKKPQVDYRALAEQLLHPTQVAVLDLMANNPNIEWSPTAMANILDRPLANVSYHVRRLEQRKLIKRVKVVQRRGALMSLYLLTEGAWSL